MSKKELKEAVEAAKKAEVKPKKKAAKATRKPEEVVEKADAMAELLIQIKASQDELEQRLHGEMKKLMVTEVRRADRRRRWSNFFHDVVIVTLIAVAVYFGYCLYSIRYFSFLKTDCERTGTCEVAQPSEPEQEVAGPVKDATWYLANYHYLFDRLQTGLDADKLDAYYLYTGDHRVSEMKPEYLLSIAYNQLNIHEGAEVRVEAEDLARAFTETFGANVAFPRADFSHGCLEFKYQEDEFVAKNTECLRNQKREIVEQVEKIYQEGELLYIATVAGLYDKTERNFYRFDNLFRPAVLGAERNELSEYATVLNRYQYQFREVDGKFYFSGVAKLQ